MEAKEQKDMPMEVDQQNSKDEEQDEVSYRLVLRQYYCYYCEKKYKKMLTLNQELICDTCHQGFCEIIDQDFDEKDIVKRQKRQDQTHRHVFTNPTQQHNILDLRDRRPDNIYGEPSQQRMYLHQQLGQVRQEEEEKKGEQRTSQEQQEQRRRPNPYFDHVGHNIFDSIFGSSPFLVGEAPSQGHTTTRIFVNPHRREQELDQHDFFGTFFRPYNYGRMFNDDGFQFMSSFRGFDPTIFATNFSQNFSSSQDPLTRILELSAQLNQAQKKPAKKEAIKKLPIVTISETHCKKVESTGKLEAPNCTVCMENLSIGTQAQFMPCGHTFHPQCLEPWLKEHNTCPICRYELPVEGQ